MAKTANRLLEGVKRRITLPSNEVLINDTDILALADDVIKIELVPLLMSLRQNYFVVRSDTLTVSGTSDYDVPYRSIGRTLRDLKLRDSGGICRDLALIASEDEHLFPVGVSPHSFYFRGDKIVLVPTPQSTGLTLDVWWDMPPSELVKLDQVGTVTAFSDPTVTVSLVPSTLATGVTCDFVQAKSGNCILGMDKAITNVAGTTLTFTAGDLPSTLVVGDYVCVAQKAPVIMLPDECYPYLETLTAKRVLMAIGDFEGQAALEKGESQELKMIKIMLEPRVVGESTKIINRRSLLRGVRSRYRRGLIY